MAFVATNWFMTVTFMDSGRNITTRRLEMQAVTHGAALTDALTVLTKLTLVTDAEILGYSISQDFNEDTVAVPANAEIENTALLTMQLTNPAKSGSFSIPAPQATIFLDTTGVNRNYVDLSASQITDILALFASGGQLYTSDGENAAGLKNGRRVHRRSSRNRSQRIG